MSDKASFDELFNLSTNEGNISDCELSYHTISSTSSELKTSNIQGSTPNKHNNRFDSDQASLGSREISSTSYSASSSGSLPKRYQVPQAKVAELKQLLCKVNDVYTEYKTSEFVLGCYKVCAAHSVIGSKIKEIIETSTIPEMSQIKTRDGKKLNILGLKDEELIAATNKELSTLEKIAMEKQVGDMIRNKTTAMKAQKDKLKDMLGKHAEKQVQEETSVLIEKQSQLCNLYESVGDTSEQCFQLLEACNEQMQELARLKHNSTKDLVCMTYRLLKEKSEYLHASTSTLKLRTELSMYNDKNVVQDLNSQGDGLSKSMEEAKTVLGNLEKKLDDYEEKEAKSEIYKKIVSEYNQALQQLKHKKQTLNVLNDWHKNDC